MISHHIERGVRSAAMKTEPPEVDGAPEVQRMMNEPPEVDPVT
jgi:hypothetical protein